MNVEPTHPPAVRRGAAPEPARAGDAADGCPSTAGMLVCISIDRSAPRVGTAACAGRAPVPFEGWLELLRAISELVGAERFSDDGPGAAEAPTERTEGDQDQS